MKVAYFLLGTCSSEDLADNKPPLALLGLSEKNIKAILSRMEFVKKTNMAEDDIVFIAYKPQAMLLKFFDYEGAPSLIDELSGGDPDDLMDEINEGHRLLVASVNYNFNIDEGEEETSLENCRMEIGEDWVCFWRNNHSPVATYDIHRDLLENAVKELNEEPQEER